MDKQVLRKRIILAANSLNAEKIIRETLGGPPAELMTVNSGWKIAA